MKLTMKNKSIKTGCLAGALVFSSLTSNALAETTASPKTEENVCVTFNFKAAPISTVLSYLSEQAGFVIVEEMALNGTVNLVSHQPLNRQEILELLNTVLYEKGAAVVATGRILKIVDLKSAVSKNLPVHMGNNPDLIPESDAVVTQVIPLNVAKAEELVQNLEPLLTSSSVISSNKTTNTILITDSQINIKRVVSVIQALDRASSGNNEVKVFPIANNDAEEIADVINELYKDSNSGSSSQNGRSAMPMMMGRGMRPPMTPTNTDNDASASISVSAVAEPGSNSVLVNAPTEMMAMIGELINQVDVPTQDKTLVGFFPLKYADAEDAVDKILELFGDDSSTNTQQAGAMFSRGMRGPSQPANTNNRSLDEVEVNAVADVRTNTVLVTTSENTMKLIREMLDQLDGAPEKVPQVFVYKLENANLENLKEMFEGMFEDFEESETTTRAGASGAGATGGTTNRSTR